MTNWRRFLETVHLTVLGIWAGSMLTTIAGAIVLFPTIKRLDPHLPAYEAYAGEHWRIAAGQPGHMLFLMLDIVQFLAVMLAVATLVTMLWFKMLDRRRISTMIRTMAMAGALVAVSYHLFLLAPKMNQDITAFWSAAKAGEFDKAEQYRTAFDSMHPIASRVLGITGVCVLVALVTGAWSATGVVGGAGGNGKADAVSSDGEAKLEVPKLAKELQR
jgi:hypothetical protein